MSEIGKPIREWEIQEAPILPEKQQEEIEEWPGEEEEIYEEEYEEEEEEVEV